MYVCMYVCMYVRIIYIYIYIYIYKDSRRARFRGSASLPGGPRLRHRRRAPGRVASDCVNVVESYYDAI